MKHLIMAAALLLPACASVNCANAAKARAAALLTVTSIDRFCPIR